jgi:hypothetical protein
MRAMSSGIFSQMQAASIIAGHSTWPSSKQRPLSPGCAILLPLLSPLRIDGIRIWHYELAAPDSFHRPHVDRAAELMPLVLVDLPSRAANKAAPSTAGLMAHAVMSQIQKVLEFHQKIRKENSAQRYITTRAARKPPGVPDCGFQNCHHRAGRFIQIRNALIIAFAPLCE